MNLVIDVGNTLVKLAVFSSEKMVYRVEAKKENVVDAVATVLKRYPNIIKCIVSSVGRLESVFTEQLSERFSVLEVDAQTPVPFTNLYSTPKTLGVDRIVLMSAAALKFPNKNVLVIDAGSCITYDFLSARTEYFGGAISPGVLMRYNAMHHFTASLPLLKAKLPKKLTGDSTANAMHVGALQGVLYEMDGFINDYSEKYKDLTVILTGGDAHLLRDSLKNDIFADSNFLLEGLHYILQYNND